MRGETLGRGWGVPASALQTLQRRRSHPLSLRLEYDAKVVRGSLLVRKVESYIFDAKRYVPLQILKMCTYPNGSHSHAMQYLPAIILGSLYYVLNGATQKHSTQERLSSRFVFGPFKCWQFATDVYLQVYHERFYIRRTRVRIVSYQDYGNRDVPPDSARSAMFQPRPWMPNA